MNPLPPTAIVTGAAQGIGRAIALEFLSLGYRVIALDRASRELAALKTLAETRGYENLLSIETVDLSRRDELETLLEQKANEPACPFLQARIIINNAGYGGPFQRITEATEKTFDEILNVNLWTVVRMAQFFLPLMQKDRFGRMIQISSIQGFLGSSHSTLYSASKHALIGLTRSLADEWGAYGITFNSICPGYVQTKMGAQSPTQEKEILKRTPNRRVSQPEEIAKLAAFLAGQDASFIQGVALPMDGGISATVGISP